MELDAQPLIDEGFLAKALQSANNNESQISVITFDIKPAVTAGNNFLSVVYRVHVEYTMGESDRKLAKSLVVKFPLEKDSIVEFTLFDFYSVEPKVYEALLPNINKKVNCEFGPKSFFCPIKDGLVLEDLKDGNYKMCDKNKQLDFSHCSLACVNLAKFHAASVSYQQEAPLLIEDIGKERLFVKGAFIDKNSMLKLHVQTICGVLEKLDGCKDIADVFMKRSDKIQDSIVNLLQPKVKGLNVLNHGDFWMNNMLFKYNDSNEVMDIKFIDFQLVRWGSPAPDLLYFVWTSANEQVREHNLNALYDIYLNTLNHTLKQLGCEERMSPEELQEDLKLSMDWVIIILSFFIPTLMCDVEDVINLEDIKTEDIMDNKRILKMFQGKRVKALLPKLITDFQTTFLS